MRELELRPGRSGLHETRRILVSWIAVASALLGKKKVTDTNIHDARKLLKKARAALRLLRGSIGEIAYQRENAALRDAARPLGVARDSKVLVSALDALVEGDEYKQLRRILRREQTQARRALTPALAKKLRTSLRAVSNRAQRWRLQGDDWDVIGDGLMRVYRRGRKKFAEAKQARASEGLHDWRKQVKYLWHQLQVLQPARPKQIGALANRCHKLAEWLGDDHDLAVLRQKIESHAEAFERASDLDELLHRLDRRRVQLQDGAFELGAKLFDDKPKAFAPRIGKYWRAWRDSVRE